LAPLWSLYIEPILRRLEPRRVMQIGVDDVQLTERLLQYCRQSGCRADIICANPTEALEDMLAGFAQQHVLTRLRTIKGVPVAEHPDVVIIDREPNWWTINAVLTLLRQLSALRGQPFPYVLLRHTEWPYGRRDMYPRPDNVDERQPFAYQGLDPDQPGLVKDGINGRFAHATVEGGPRNGVMTGIEDFIAAAPFQVAFWSLPFFNGLGILSPKSRVTPEIQTLIDGFFSAESLIEASKAAERETARLQLRLSRAEDRLEVRTVALKRARDLLSQQQAEIAALSKQLGAGRTSAPEAPLFAEPRKAEDLADVGRLAVTLAREGRAEEALVELRKVIEQLPHRQKGWRPIMDVLKGTTDTKLQAAVWRACIGVWASLAGADPDLADRLGGDLASRMFAELAALIQRVVSANPDNVIAAWRLFRELYADPAFGELAARYPQQFADFVRSSGEDLYLKAEGKHGANLNVCVYDALDRFASPSRRDELLAICRADMTDAHGGLEHVAQMAERLLRDPEFLRPVIVCGFHHSGTRLLARQLAALGIKQQINVYQYEWRYVIQLNALLKPGCLDPARLGSGPEEADIISPERLAFRMALAGLEPGQTWGFKDPRNGLTVDAWLKAFPGARVLNLLRDPVATLGTLPEVYDQFVHLDERRTTPTQFWSELWEASVQGARLGMAAADAAIEIRFEDLCAEPEAVLERVMAALGVEAAVTPDKLTDVAIQSGKSDLRDEVKQRLPSAEFQSLEALAERYGYA